MKQEEKRLILKAPINSLSFGNVSFNLMREMFKSGVKVGFFPIGENIDLGSFDKVSPEFSEWIKASFDSRLEYLASGLPTLQLWHINGSENRVSEKQTLFTFYELDQPTKEECQLVSHQSHCVFSSNHAAQKFYDHGCKEGISAIPIGFDEDFHVTEKKYLGDRIHFGLMGKFEKRKHTAKIIKAWLKKYGNNYKYQLTCCVTNPFIKPEQMNVMLSQLLDGKSYGNINFVPFLKTNSEVNDLLNAIDIDLTGLSGAEGWNLPSFNSTALGKWSVVLNHTSHKDWATESNSILIEPEGLEPAEDGIFFSKGGPFNQGNINSISEDSVISAMEESEKKAKSPNPEGEKLRKDFSYKNTLDKILELTIKPEMPF